MRSFRANHNLVAVSANSRETAINTEQTLDTSLLVSLNDVLDLDRRREHNGEELTGKEEPDTVYDLGAQAKGNLNFEKAQPQHFAFLLAFAMGSVTTAAAGTGYQHTITPLSNDLDLSRSLPSFTAAQRLGLTVLKRRFASMFVDSVTATFAADSWVRLSAAVKGTGKITKNVTEETVSALSNATSLTLAANAVHGSTAAERLDNVHQIFAELTAGVWTEVAFSAVSADTPAVITITDPGGDGGSSVDYKIVYVPTEAAWATFPARVSETPLRVAECTFTIGGAWNGTSFTGGRQLDAEIRNVEWQLQNNMEIEFTFGAGDAYAGRAFRSGRAQTLKLGREMRDYLLQNYIDNNDYFGVYILAQGAVYDDPHRYQVEIIFPRCNVLNAPVSVDGRRIAEAGDLIVLEDDTYGSAIVKVKNLQAAYAA